MVLTSSSIRGEGDAAFGQWYYYFVMPGVVCHETAHAAACLCTGIEIVEFAPFKPQGDILGYVKWDPGNITLWTFIAAFLIGTAPLWFGCMIVWLICKLLVKTKFLPDYKGAVFLFPGMSGFSYWKQVIFSSFSMIKSLLKRYKLSSLFNLFILYLLFSIISEMPPSIPDLQAGLPGFILLLLLFFLVNLIPCVGKKIDQLTVRLQPLFFTMHSVMVFVFFLDILFMICVAFTFSVLF